MSHNGKITVLNPIGFPPEVKGLGMTERPANLQGRPVYLVDVRFDDSDLLLDQMQAWFAEHMPQVETVRRSKLGTYHEDDPALFQEMKDRGAVCVIAVGH